MLISAVQQSVLIIHISILFHIPFLTEVGELDLQCISFKCTTVTQLYIHIFFNIIGYDKLLNKAVQ